MLRIRFAYFSLLCTLLEVRRSLATNTTVVTTFTGLQGDYNFGHSGYVYLQSDTTFPELELSSCQYYDVNQTTCSFVDQSPKSDSSVMVLRAWTAVTLRDNILALLGYLIHRSDETFYQDNKSALRLLYDEVRRNNIKSMDLLPRIKSMAKTSRVSQVLALFKTFQSVVPPFCRSAVDELGKTFSKKKDLLKNILGTHKGPDLFADIGLQMVPLLRIKNTRKNYDKTVGSVVGKEFAILFAAIQDGRVVLTQPVLAAMMLNMKFDGLTSEAIEDFHFFTDVLRLNKIPDWSPGFSGSCCLNYKDPYDLVHAMIKTIAERPKIDPMIKRTVSRLLPRLVKNSEYFVSKKMNRLFGHPNFNISIFLDILADEVKIPEVNIFRLLVSNGSLSLAYALKGFVRYFYDTPKKIVLAFMERIKYRLPMSNEAKSQVNAILYNLRGSCMPDMSENAT